MNSVSKLAARNFFLDDHSYSRCFALAMGNIAAMCVLLAGLPSYAYRHMRCNLTGYGQDDATGAKMIWSTPKRYFYVSSLSFPEQEERTLIEGVFARHKTIPGSDWSMNWNFVDLGAPSLGNKKNEIFVVDPDEPPNQYASDWRTSFTAVSPTKANCANNDLQDDDRAKINHIVESDTLIRDLPVQDAQTAEISDLPVGWATWVPQSHEFDGSVVTNNFFARAFAHENMHAAGLWHVDRYLNVMLQDGGNFVYGGYGSPSQRTTPGPDEVKGIADLYNDDPRPDVPDIGLTNWVPANANGVAYLVPDVLYESPSGYSITYGTSEAGGQSLFCAELVTDFFFGFGVLQLAACNHSNVQTTVDVFAMASANDNLTWQDIPVGKTTVVMEPNEGCRYILMTIDSITNYSRFANMGVYRLGAITSPTKNGHGKEIRQDNNKMWFSADYARALRSSSSGCLTTDF